MVDRLVVDEIVEHLVRLSGSALWHHVAGFFDCDQTEVLFLEHMAGVVVFHEPGMPVLVDELA